MPLESGPVGSAAFKHNIAEMVNAGHPVNQAVAAAYREAGERKDSAEYPIKLIIELSESDFVRPLVKFFQEVRTRANRGHSFLIEADRDAGKNESFHVGIDGDGDDKIGRIFLNDSEVTAEKRHDSMDCDKLTAITDAVAILDSRLDAMERRRADGGDEPGNGDEPYGDVKYADPGYRGGKKRYPVDTEEHIRAAWSYFNKPTDKDEYSPEDRRKVRENIIRAWKEKIDKDGPPETRD